MKLWLVRHAAPVVEPGTCYGRSDVAADPKGSADAARELAAAMPGAIRVATSPSGRCTQLARDLQALRPELAFTQDARLQELDFGSWELRPWAAIPRDALDRWTADFGRHRPGGGEAVQELLTRVRAALEDAVRDGGDQLWITHAGVLRAAGLLVQGTFEVTDAGQWPAIALPFGSWQVHDLARLSVAGPPSPG